MQVGEANVPRVRRNVTHIDEHRCRNRTRDLKPELIRELPQGESSDGDGTMLAVEVCRRRIAIRCHLLGGDCRIQKGNHAVGGYAPRWIPSVRRWPPRIEAAKKNGLDVPYTLSAVPGRDRLVQMVLDDVAIIARKQEPDRGSRGEGDV